LWEGPHSKACEKFGAPHLRRVQSSSNADTYTLQMLGLLEKDPNNPL
jgi:hypothetical protein